MCWAPLCTNCVREVVVGYWLGMSLCARTRPSCSERATTEDEVQQTVAHALTGFNVDVVFARILVVVVMLVGDDFKFLYRFSSVLAHCVISIVIL